ncbi:hypothetical protein EMCRGX_G011446 [Ephydatia muelleri]
MEELKGWMHQLVADMQTSILGRISDIEQNIQSLSDRVSSLERQNEAVDVLQQADETATAAMPHQTGLVTYKRTLKRALTSNDSTSRRVKRSRQQRLWEKRCQVLKDDEKQLWGDTSHNDVRRGERRPDAKLYNVAVRRGVLIG